MASTSTSNISKAEAPPHGILKKDPSHKHPERKNDHAKFDEMNILETYHPADKDYGHMKIDEPKTPYREDIDSDGEGINADVLADRLNNPNDFSTSRVRSVSTDDDDDQCITEEAKARKKKFDAARKQHYNMKDEMRKSKELLEKEMAELEDE